MKENKVPFRITSAVIINEKPLDIFVHSEKFMEIVKSVAIEYGSSDAAEHVAEESYSNYVKGILELSDHPTATLMEIARPEVIKMKFNKNNPTEKELDDFIEYLMSTFSIKFKVKQITEEDMRLLAQGRSKEAIDLIFEDELTTN